MTGTIAANGSISGTWNDDAFGTPRTGTFTMPAGSATPAVTFCGKGTASYTDEQNNWYLMNVKAVSVEGNTAWIAAQILASSSNLGYENTPTNYLFLKVTDIAEPGIGHDYMGGDLMTETDAVAAVLAHNDPSATATINAGNIQVH
jgi:hypothetical protein